ncbi:hypothetical protein KC324_g88 [Hortaea werneckii]|nr:hypothetical protein KC324_g88 [Hortaea werneckii]
MTDRRGSTQKDPHEVLSLSPCFFSFFPFLPLSCKIVTLDCRSWSPTDGRHALNEKRCKIVEGSLIGYSHGRDPLISASFDCDHANYALRFVDTTIGTALVESILVKVIKGPVLLDHLALPLVLGIAQGLRFHILCCGYNLIISLKRNPTIGADPDCVAYDSHFLVYVFLLQHLVHGLICILLLERDRARYGSLLAFNAAFCELRPLLLKDAPVMRQGFVMGIQLRNCGPDVVEMSVSPPIELNVFQSIFLVQFIKTQREDGSVLPVEDAGYITVVVYKNVVWAEIWVSDDGLVQPCFDRYCLNISRYSLSNVNRGLPCERSHANSFSAPPSSTC